MSPEFVYTFSSRRRMPYHLLHSLKTLLRYVDPSDVTVFATPPVEDEHVDRIGRLGVGVERREHRAESFATTGLADESHYADKTWMTTVEADEVVFLDCDTLVLDDPSPVLEGEFDFKARPGSAVPEGDEWEWLFRRHGKPVLEWMPNSGFLVFKNGVHRRIEGDWLRFLDLEFPDFHVMDLREQYALALAVSEYRCRKMTPNEHVFEWSDGIVPDGVVYHLGPDRTTPRRLKLLFGANARVPINLIKWYVKATDRTLPDRKA